jgi:iron complex transport system permease protein
MLRKDFYLFSALIALIVAGGFISLSSGSWQISVSHVPMIILSKMGLYAGTINDVEAAIVWDGRLPRFLVALLVGFSLGGAGTIMQGIFKNPMASPGVMGIDSGAALGAVLAIYLGLASGSLVALPLRIFFHTHPAVVLPLRPHGDGLQYQRCCLQALPLIWCWAP